MKSSAQLREELKEAEARERAEKEALQAAVEVKMQYILKVDDRPGLGHIYDPSVLMYRLEGTCVNREEVQAVGKKAFEGGMSYYFNTLSGKVISRVSGGNLHIGTLSHAPGAQEKDLRDMEALSEFIRQNPDGGDMTELVVALKENG